ncbi:hypothetical protein B0T16DRAFT_63104 [Cercophora newfieldiana]|uniref:Uncharacterized protein n=1 Tax=Cercophora newfieldiana TaxID=92897 RepID=A0AA40CZT7_9PEZI|nr:hypothetical protein B0T16DRAFT_63104 [Cercophora newfieldiana]
MLPPRPQSHPPTLGTGAKRCARRGGGSWGGVEASEPALRQVDGAECPEELRGTKIATTPPADGFGRHKTEFPGSFPSAPQAGSTLICSSAPISRFGFMPTSDPRQRDLGVWLLPGIYLHIPCLLYICYIYVPVDRMYQ